MGRAMRRAKGSAPEPRDRTERLHLAQFLGQQAAATAANESATPFATTCSTPPTLAVGVITAPKNADRRGRMRAARLRLLGSQQCAATLTFILGTKSMMPANHRSSLAAEEARHKDLVYLRAHDGIQPGISHGGRAVAEKGLAWFIYAATNTKARFVGKLDDDTMAHLPRLVADLMAVAARAPNPEYIYYGVQVYRMWDWTSQPREPNAACGGHNDDGPPGHARGSSLQKLLHAKASGTCRSASGPFPFPDGSLEVAGRAVLESIFGCARVRAYADSEYHRPRAPYWTHEDAGLGALVHREVEERRLPITYVALRRWEHNRFWVNWADLSTLVDGNVLWVHYTRDAERAEYVTDAYMARRALPADGLSCGHCLDQWGWQPPHNGTTCCIKPDTRPRMASPRRVAELPTPTCGLGDEGVSLRLAVISEGNQMDEREAARRVLATHRSATADARVCFVLKVRLALATAAMGREVTASRCWHCRRRWHWLRLQRAGRGR